MSVVIDGRMKRDSFSDEVRERMTSAGWVITHSHRYEPTIVQGLTPSGKAFTFTATVDGTGVTTLTLDVAGRTRQAVGTRAQLFDGPTTVTALLTAHQSLPGPQQ